MQMLCNGEFLDPILNLQLLLWPLFSWARLIISQGQTWNFFESCQHLHSLCNWVSSNPKALERRWIAASLMKTIQFDRTGNCVSMRPSKIIFRRNTQLLLMTLFSNVYRVCVLRCIKQVPLSKLIHIYTKPGSRTRRIDWSQSKDQLPML